MSALGDIVQTNSEVTGVEYHPTLEHLFITSDASGRVVLRDARMAFGLHTKRNDEGIVQRVS